MLRGRPPVAMRWDVKCISTGRLFFFWETEDVPKEPQLAVSNIVDKRLGVCHGIYRGVWDMILSFDVEHDPVAGGRKGVDFTFHII